MKKRVLLALALSLSVVSLAQAGIRNSKHDLANSNAGATSIKASAASTAQTCQFCHTPHNAIMPKLLWNRTNINTMVTFKVYTSYNNSYMKNDLKAASSNNWSLGSDSVSLLCMSCHSLPTAGDIFGNTGGHTSDVTAGNDGNWIARTGNWSDLTKSHPVGISYTAAAGSTGGGAAFVAKATAALKTPLFITNGVSNGDSMECGSCHAVHDPTNYPFLRMNNTGSALCLNCHIK